LRALSKFSGTEEVDDIHKDERYPREERLDECNHELNKIDIFIIVPKEFENTIWRKTILASR